jgi:hypothetical protein
MIFTDPTGKFITPSVSGNQYALIVYEYDGNYIYGAPMPDRTGPYIIAASKKLIRLVESRGFKPLLQRLDNEASHALHTFMDEEDIYFQLAPPQVHLRNAAECAIRTFKNQFIAGLCSTNRDFPLNLWKNYYPSASSLSTSSDAQESIHNCPPKPTCMAPLISIALLSPHQAQNLAFMRNPIYNKHGLLTPSKVGTLALPFATTGATVSGHGPPMQNE